jgi:ribonuclease VapC
LPSVVFDASALICLLRHEPGWEAVAKYGLTSLVSAVNMVEVVYVMRGHGMALEAVETAIKPVVGRVVPFDNECAYVTAAVHAQTRHIGLSLADCACLALGMTEKAIVVTADKEWRNAGLDLSVVQIR